MLGLLAIPLSMRSFGWSDRVAAVRCSPGPGGSIFLVLASNATARHPENIPCSNPASPAKQANNRAAEPQVVAGWMVLAMPEYQGPKLEELRLWVAQVQSVQPTSHAAEPNHSP